MPHAKEKGINPALPILIILVVLFIVAVSYLATPPDTPFTHTYFDQEAFSLPTGQTWHVGVPVTQDGSLHLSITSNSTVQVYVKNGNSYLLNSQVIGYQNFTLPVTSAMNMLDVGVINNGLQPAAVLQFTCVWTS